MKAKYKVIGRSRDTRQEYNLGEIVCSSSVKASQGAAIKAAIAGMDVAAVVCVEVIPVKHRPKLYRRPAIMMDTPQPRPDLNKLAHLLN